MSTEVRHAGDVPEWKVKEVEELVDRISKSPVVGIVGIRELPASDFQQVREEMRSTSDIKVIRNNIARRAIEQSEEAIRPLADFIEDQSALIFTNFNPFQLKRILDGSKKPMPIKGGSATPIEIAVEAGETSFSPGPMVGKLQGAGIPAAIKAGKVVINQRVVLAKAGETVPQKLAEILEIMEIFPRNVGLELRAVYQDGVVFKPADLALDVDAILAQVAEASAKAFSFAVELAYVTPQTLEPILQHAQAKAKGLVAEAGIPIPGMMEIVLLKAQANAQTIEFYIGGGNAEVKSEQAPAAVVVEETVEEEEENKEEDVAEGLGSLFG